MPKQDYKKINKEYFTAPTHEPVILALTSFQYLMLDGSGYPDEECFKQAAGCLFATSYVIKFSIKAKNPEHDYVVLPMEVKWSLNRKYHGSRRYNWTMMVMQPPFVKKNDLLGAIKIIKEKKKNNLLRLNEIRLRSMQEGLCAQILHKGPYGKPMDQTFELLKKQVTKLGYIHEKDSHDIYLNDPRRVAPEKLKTLMRVKLFPITKGGQTNE